jgi:hypothetical protein
MYREPALVSNQSKVIQIADWKTKEQPITSVTQANQQTNVEAKSRLVIKSDKSTHWTDELSQSQALALAKTYARIIEMGGHLGA